MEPNKPRCLECCVVVSCLLPATTAWMTIGARDAATDNSNQASFVNLSGSSQQVALSYTTYPQQFHMTHPNTWCDKLPIFYNHTSNTSEQPFPNTTLAFPRKNGILPAPTLPVLRSFPNRRRLPRLAEERIREASGPAAVAAAARGLTAVWCAGGRGAAWVWGPHFDRRRSKSFAAVRNGELRCGETVMCLERGWPHRRLQLGKCSGSFPLRFRGKAWRDDRDVCRCRRSAWKTLHV